MKKFLNKRIQVSRRLICTLIFIQAIGVLEINVEIMQEEINLQQALCEKVAPYQMA